MGLIARIKSRMYNRPDVVEIEKVEGGLEVSSLLAEIIRTGVLNANDVRLHKGSSVLTLDYVLLESLINKTANKSTLYRHHIIITTEYSGAYKNLIFDIYNTTATAVTKTNMPSSMAGKYYVCTGNIISSTGVTTGICHGKFEMVGGNPQVRGINSSGDEFYAGINNLNDTVEEITKITHE